MNAGSHNIIIKLSFELETVLYFKLKNFNAIMLTIINITVSSKLVTLVEGDPKAPFLIATTPMCRGGCYSFPWIAPLYL